MGSESIIYGRIEGAIYRSGDAYRSLQDLNQIAVNSLPDLDSWPFLTRWMFAFPGPFPHGGIYRAQIIHIGASFKEIEPDLRDWLDKFEILLRRMYWFSARIHLESELGRVDEFM